MDKSLNGIQWQNWLNSDLPDFLVNFSPNVEKILEVGCWGSNEPYALLWTLDAKEIMVIEKEKAHLDEMLKQHPYIRARFGERMEGRKITPIVADISSDIPELPNDYFDLAYCSDVLYSLLYEKENSEGLVFALAQMARAVKPGGIVIAIESKLGAKFNHEPDPLFGGTIPVQVSDPIDISNLFEAMNLIKMELPERNYWEYFYRKRIVLS